MPLTNEAPTQSTRWRAPLNRPTVLAAALALIDGEGVEALTMRRLGQVLGREATAVYRDASGRPSPTSALRPREDSPGLLLRASFRDGDLMHLCRAVRGLLYGHLLNQFQPVVRGELVDVAVVGRRQLAGWLSRQPVVADDDEIERIHAAARRSTPWRP